VSEEEQNGKKKATKQESAAEPPDTTSPIPELASSGDEVAVEDAASQLEALAIERDNLAVDNAELRELLLRRQAEFENLRRRMENERTDFARYAGMEIVGELLPLIDDFERALEAMPDGEGPEGEFVKGIEIIYKRFLAILEKIGLEPIESVGKPFDPNLQHAVETVATDEVDENTVIEEWQKGYNFKGKLLREAMVKVSVRPSETPGATDCK